MNNKGMTLLELMVYMVLAALVLAPIIMLMQNSSMTMARDSASTNLRMSGRDLLNIIYDDFKNTGFKVNPADFILNWGGATYAGDNTCPPPHDSSSFKASTSIGNSLFDSITVRMGELNTDGVWVGTDSITYYVDSYYNLKRRSVKLNTAGGRTSSEKTLTDNVVALKFEFSDNVVDWRGPADFNCSNIEDKADMQFIRVSIILKDDKKLAAARNRPEIAVADTTFYIQPDDLALYELHSIVVPIPNNGL